MIRATRPRRSILLAVIVTALMAFPAGIVLAAHQFGDVPNTNDFHADIDALVDAGVTAGCGSGNYCPKANVTREQMAAFMNRLGALAPGKTPVVNADRVDGYQANQLIRGSSATASVNGASSPKNNTITSVTAPTVGGLQVTLNFACVSFSGTTNTRWDITMRVDGADVHGGSSDIVLTFPHADLATATPGASGSVTAFAPVAAGAIDIGYTATRDGGDGSLDCNIRTSSLFMPFGDGGGTPASVEAVDTSGGADNE